MLGISAGGGLGVSLVAKARDERLDPPLAGLMAIYPMVDPGSQRRRDEGDVTKEMAFINRGWDSYLRGYEDIFFRYACGSSSSRAYHLLMILRY